jgi:YegS/Rv2252/BmrU family lipid kinase
VNALIIHNPAAGQRDKLDEIRLVADALTEAGWQVTVSAVDEQAGATEHARAAADAGCDVVFVAGGDGTVSRVVDGLLGSETVLAVLPAGTGNVLARQLNLPVPGGFRPRPMLDALPLLLAGQPRRVDVGVVSVSGGVARHFVCWSGVGFDAQVTKTVDAEVETKQRLGKMAFVVAALRTLRRYGGTRAVIRVDGQRVRLRLIMLVANNIQLYGAWIKMAPRATLDDGWLDVYAFRGRDPVRTFLAALRLLVDRNLQIPEIRPYRARRIEIITARPLPVHVDGDTIGNTPAVIAVEPQALKLLVPTSAPASLFVDGAGASESETVLEWVARLARDAQTALLGKGSPQ